MEIKVKKHECVRVDSLKLDGVYEPNCADRQWKPLEADLRIKIPFDLHNEVINIVDSAKDQGEVEDILSGFSHISVEITHWNRFDNDEKCVSMSLKNGELKNIRDYLNTLRFPEE